MKMHDEKDMIANLKGFIDGLTKAAGAAHQMVHTHQDPRFLPIRDRLEAIRQRAVHIAQVESKLRVIQHAH